MNPVVQEEGGELKTDFDEVEILTSLVGSLSP
jgi:hypothetical protein